MVGIETRQWWIWMLFAMLCCGGAQAQDVLSQAKKLMEEGKAEQAFNVLAPLEPQRAGETDFDYTLGIAALDSGRPDRATIAFERVLALNPNFAGARIDLARAYYAMGSDDLAKSEFETVLKLKPPEHVKPVIAKYLLAIEARNRKLQPSLTGFVEAGGGTDSNITAVTNDFAAGVLQAYNIAAVAPTGNSIKRSGAFSQVAAGAEYSRPLDGSLSWYIGGDLRDRHHYNDNSPFDSQQLDARGGIALNLERDLFKFGLQSQRYYQEAVTPLAANGTRISNDRNTSGVVTEWRHALAAGRQIGLFAQLNEQRFPSNLPQNIDQVLVGGQFLNVWEGRGSPLLMLAAFQSRDKAKGPLNVAATSDVSKTITGLRALLQYSLTEALDVYALAGHTERADDSQFARSIVAAYGKDRLFDTGLGLNWRFMPTWSLRGQAAFYENRSNIALYEYKRTEISVLVRKDFK